MYKSRVKSDRGSNSVNWSPISRSQTLPQSHDQSLLYSYSWSCPNVKLLSVSPVPLPYLMTYLLDWSTYQSIIRWEMKGERETVWMTSYRHNEKTLDRLLNTLSSNQPSLCPLAPQDVQPQLKYAIHSLIGDQVRAILYFTRTKLCLSSSPPSQGSSKHFIPHSAITCSVQTEDIVACVLLLYNPATRCPLHVHAYRCDSEATAEALNEQLQILINRPENQKRFADLESRYVGKLLTRRERSWGLGMDNLLGKKVMLLLWLCCCWRYDILITNQT